MFGRLALLSRVALFRRRALCRGGSLRRDCALFGRSALRGRRELSRLATETLVETDATRQALREVLYCERILAKTGDSVLRETLGNTETINAWAHFPEGDVYDPDSGGQWYYHCHPPEEAATEHGHFHCFVRPEGRDGPVHHLVGVGVDAYGRLLRLFTVNHWVVGDDWLGADATIALLPRFDLQLGRPSYLVNRWLTAVVRFYSADIADLIAARDRTIEAHLPEDPDAARADRALEVTSEVAADLGEAAGRGSVET